MLLCDEDISDLCDVDRDSTQVGSALVDHVHVTTDPCVPFLFDLHSTDIVVIQEEFDRALTDLSARSPPTSERARSLALNTSRLCDVDGLPPNSPSCSLGASADESAAKDRTASFAL